LEFYGVVTYKKLELMIDISGQVGKQN